MLYGEFDDFLFWSLPRETERFFEEILGHDRSVTDFVDSDWTFLNQRLAQHYGIAGVSGGELRRVKLPPGSHRGGVLTHASILKVTADGTRTSPVLRGKWVLDRILGQPPAPPPPDIPVLEPDIRGATTIRQQLDKHRNTVACASCHRHIDPPGFALESFDVIGGWRDFYRATQPGRRKPRRTGQLPGPTDLPRSRRRARRHHARRPAVPHDRRLQTAPARGQGPVGPQPRAEAAHLRHRGRHPVRRPRGGRGSGGKMPRPEIRLPVARARGGSESDFLE